jgi:hypothetical protein
MNALEANLIEVPAAMTGTSAKGKSWSKQSILVRTDGAYPKSLYLTTFREDLQTAIKNLPMGAKVKITYEAESREYKGSWYTDAVLLSINQG